VIHDGTIAILAASLEHQRSTCRYAVQVEYSIGIDVRGRQPGRHSAGRSINIARSREQRAIRQGISRGFGATHRHRLGLCAHTGIFELREAGARIVGKALVIRQHFTGFVGTIQTAKHQSRAVISAAQVGVELDGSLIIFQRAFQVTLLQECLGDKIDRVRVSRVGSGNALQMLQRPFDLPKIETQKPADILGSQMGRIAFQDTRQDLQGPLFPALLLHVQGGNGQIDPGIQPLGLPLDHFREGVPGAPVIKVSHQRNAAIVLDNVLIAQFRTAITGHGQDNEDHADQRPSPWDPSR